MPNHITNIVTLETLDNNQLRDMCEFVEGTEEEGDLTIPFSLQQICPMPSELKDQQSPFNGTEEDSRRLNTFYGADNWYDWRVKNWGTKWEAYGHHQISDNCYQFDTAWSTPVQALFYLSRKFPTASIHLRFADEDMGYNVGKAVIKNGKVVEESYPESGSEEAYQMAGGIKGYNRDEIEEMLGEANAEAK